MENRFIAPGLWEIENFTVERQSHGTWQIRDGEGDR